MYKSTARSSHYLRRTGNYATHGSRAGLVSIVPKEPVLDWHPEYFEGHYVYAKLIIAELDANGHRCLPGTDAAAAVAACHHMDRTRALDAMREMIERMAIHG